MQMQLAEEITYNNGFFVLFSHTNDGKDRTVAAILPGFSTVVLPGRNDEEIEFRNGSSSYFARGTSKAARDAYLLSLAAFVTAASPSEVPPQPQAPLEEHKQVPPPPQEAEKLPTIPMIKVTDSTTTITEAADGTATLKSVFGELETPMKWGPVSAEARAEVEKIIEAVKQIDDAQVENLKQEVARGSATGNYINRKDRPVRPSASELSDK